MRIEILRIERLVRRQDPPQRVFPEVPQEWRRHLDRHAAVPAQVGLHQHRLVEQHRPAPVAEVGADVDRHVVREVDVVDVHPHARRQRRKHLEDQVGHLAVDATLHLGGALLLEEELGDERQARRDVERLEDLHLGLRAEAEARRDLVGEEAVAELRIPQCGDRFFLVDPLDGTRGFAKGGDEFTVNIALIEQGVPTMGVVFAPAEGTLYAGEPGHALRAKYDPTSGEEIEALTPIQTESGAPARWRIVASELSGRNAATDSFITALNGACAHASSSIKFCRIAEGAADLYPRFGDVSEWDAAAGHAVLNAAGGGVMRLDGSPLRYGDRDGGFLIRSFIAYGSDAAKAAALGAIKR